MNLSIWSDIYIFQSLFPNLQYPSYKIYVSRKKLREHRPFDKVNCFYGNYVWYLISKQAGKKAFLPPTKHFLHVSETIQQYLNSKISLVLACYCISELCLLWWGICQLELPGARVGLPFFSTFLHIAAEIWWRGWFTWGLNGVSSHIQPFCIPLQHPHQGPFFLVIWSSSKYYTPS